MADIRFSVEVDTAKGTAEIKKLEGDIGGLGKTSEKGGFQISGMWKQVAMGLGVTWGISKAIKELTGFVGGSIKAAEIQEDAENALRTALEMTGREVDKNARLFINYASSIQDVTKYGDQQVIQAEAQLFQLTKLDRDGVQRAIRGIAGLTSTFKASGMTFETATNLIVKSLSSEINALGRYGLKLSENLTAEQRQKAILEWLEKMWPRATAETNTYSGAIAQLKNVWGDFKEEIGKAITKNEMVQEVIKGTTKTIKDQIPNVEKAVNSWNLYWSAVKEVVDKFKEKEKIEVPELGTEEWAKYLKMTQSLTRQDWDLIDATVKLHESLKNLHKEVGTLPKEYQKIEQAQKKTFIPKLVSSVDWELKKLEKDLKEYGDVADEELSYISGLWDAQYDDMMKLTEGYGVLYGWMEKIGIAGQKETEVTKEKIKGNEALWDSLSAGSELLYELGTKEKAFQYAGAIIDTARAVTQAIANYAPPYSWILAAISAAMGAAQIAIIASTTIPGKEKGGWVGLYGPEIVRVGERGPEYIIPHSVNRYNTYNQGTQVSLHFHTPLLLAENLSDRTIESAGEKLFKEIDKQAQRRGWKLNG